MVREEFMPIFKSVSDNIIDLGISKGYFYAKRKDELEQKLNNILSNDVLELDETQGLALTNPNNNTLGFNMSQIKTQDEAIALVFHELKHALDKYNNYDNEQHIDNSHVGFNQLHSGIDIGLNESITDRFATNMAETFTGIHKSTTAFNSFMLNFQTNMERYQIEDKLNQLFCVAVGISMDDLISMQNEENMDRFNEVISKFNECASYERYSTALDGIYELRYGPNSKMNGFDFTEDEIMQIHEYIQLAQDELERYIMFKHPEEISELKKEFIEIEPRYKINEEKKEKLVAHMHKPPIIDTNDTNLTDIFAMIRGDLIESAVEATELSTRTDAINSQIQNIKDIKEQDRTNQNNERNK